jgi:predicted alpha/beta hydrolase
MAHVEVQRSVSEGAFARPITISAADAQPLALSCFEPFRGPVRANVLFLHGIGLPRRVFRPLGEWLAGGGIRSVSWGWLFPHVPDARERFAALRAPLVAYGAWDDLIAPPSSVGALLACFTGTRPERVVIELGSLPAARVGHFDLLRPLPDVQRSRPVHGAARSSRLRERW